MAGEAMMTDSGGMKILLFISIGLVVGYLFGRESFERRRSRPLLGISRRGRRRRR